MTWKEYARLLRAQRNQFTRSILGEYECFPFGDRCARVPWDLFPTIREFSEYEKVMRASWQQQASAAETAIKTFTKTRQWMPLSPIQRYFCLQHIVYALDFIVGLRVSIGRKLFAQPPEELSEEEVLNWLLLTLWDERGCYAWFDTLYAQWQDYQRWQNLKESWHRQTYAHSKLVGLFVKQLNVHESAEIRRWECALAFEDGRKFVGFVPSHSEPDMGAVKSAFINDWRAFRRIQ